MPNGFEKLAECIGKSLETVPEIYNDTFKPAAQQSGKVLAVIPQTIYSALLPLRKWNIEREYNFHEIEKLLEQKLENISPDKIVTPDAYIAVPALQAISYSMDSEELRNLYANLLAKSMNIDAKSTVHPSFVDIIKSMSPLDSRVFKFIMEHHSSHEIGSYCIKSMQLETYISKTIAKYVTAITFAPYTEVENSIENLSRNNLIFPDDFIYSNESMYQEIENTPDFIQIKNEFEPIIEQCEPGFSFYAQKTALKSTRFGRLFYEVCVAT